jgi:hypothetical protein
MITGSLRIQKWDNPIRYRVATSTAWTSHNRGWICLRHALRLREGTILYVSRGHEIIAVLDIGKRIEEAVKYDWAVDEDRLCRLVQGDVNRVILKLPLNI